MPLKPDQRAMLQLLLERDQSYEDIGGVLGADRDEVRERARAALAELGGADPDADVDLTDYLLGQADPIGRADAVRHLQSDPETLALAEQIAAQLQLLAPDAELPELPRPKGAKRTRAAEPVDDDKPASARRAAPKREGASGVRAIPVPESGRRMWEERRAQSIAILATAGAALVVLILGVAGVFGGADDSAADTEEAQPGLAIAPLEVKKDGTASFGIPLPQEVLPVVLGASDISVSLSSDEELRARGEAAVAAGSPLVDYQDSETVARGAIADATAENPRTGPTLLQLEPPDGGNVKGVAIFRTEAQKAFMDVQVKGLEDPSDGQNYLVWLLFEPGTEFGTQAPAGGAPPSGAAPPSDAAPPVDPGAGGQPTP